MPEDLTAALDEAEAARETFETVNARNRYANLHRVTTARTPQTRQRRLDRLVEMLSRGETPHPQ